MKVDPVSLYLNVLKVLYSIGRSFIGLDSKFMITVDGKQVPYEEVSKQGVKTRELVISMHKGSGQEVKIEGTEVVREFGFPIMFIVLGIVMGLSMILSKKNVHSLLTDKHSLMSPSRS